MEGRKIIALHETESTEEVNKLLQNPRMELGKTIQRTKTTFIVAEYDK